MMNGYSQTFIENRYKQWAKVYDWLTPLYLLGSEKRLRQRTVAALRLQPGQAVLDVACGTGRNFPWIQAKIGPGGHLVGLDYTGPMLARAQERVECSGWKNVVLIQADAGRMDLKQKFDAILCTLAFGVIPDERGALERMLAHLKPGGHLAIGDARVSSRWYGRLLNWIPYGLGYGAAEVMTRQPWVALRQVLADFSYQDWAWGFFYVTAGRTKLEQELR